MKLQVEGFNLRERVGKRRNGHGFLRCLRFSWVIVLLGEKQEAKWGDF